MPEALTFEEHSKNIASSFLQSVVVVDDGAFLHEWERPRPHGKLVKPGRGTKPIKESPQPGEPTSEDKTHDLDAKVLIDTFAEKGLICSVLKPTLMESFEDKALNASLLADIVVLDWQLQGTEFPDKDASGLIAKIIHGERAQDRIRLIAIYSAESAITVKSKIAETLKQYGDFVAEDDDYTFIQNATRICLFAKKGIIGAAPGRAVNEKELPDKLIGEFSQMTMGLLSNAALASLAALRQNTHRILGRFRNPLDAPYLLHRILTSPPEEAEMHIVPLVVSEIESILEDAKVSDSVYIKQIEAWLDWHIQHDPPLYRRMRIKSKTEAKTAMLNLLNKGINGENKSRSHKTWKKLLSRIKTEKDQRAPSRLTDIFTSDGKSGEICDRELALLMSTRSQYQSPAPSLTLGTIVAEDIGDETHYLVCIQPKCDSVRLPRKGREFPFLPLTPVEKATSSDFGYIVRDRETLVELQLSLKPHDSLKVHFQPTKRGQPIYASPDQGRWLFKSSSPDTTPLRWVATLKPDHAQRVANDFGREITRVGLTESEWLRRCAKKR